jgi:L-lysine 6-transaminase
LSGARGRGLIWAFDLPDSATRDRFYQGIFDLGLLAIKCGERSIRFRPALDFPEDKVAAVTHLLREQCRRMSGQAVLPA